MITTIGILAFIVAFAGKCTAIYHLHRFHNLDNIQAAFHWAEVTIHASYVIFYVSLYIMLVCPYLSTLEDLHRSDAPRKSCSSPGMVRLVDSHACVQGLH